MKKTSLIIVTLLFSFVVSAQVVDNNQIKIYIASFKTDAKGPYKDIRWFCNDGTTRPPKERCPEPGVQRARYKDLVASLGQTNHLYLGQILATTDAVEFWDEPNFHSRIKQYQLENYLRRIDDGWILRKAQYYRGAFQAEDEANWGVEFFQWLLADNNQLTEHFYLIREAAKDIPHQGDDNKTMLIRSLSKEISDSDPAFVNIRVKIHGQPESVDIQSVKKFKEKNKSRLSDIQLKKMDELLALMDEFYQPANMESIKKYLKRIPNESEVGKALLTLTNKYSSLSGQNRVVELSGLLWMTRDQITTIPTSTGRLALLDISLKLEELLFVEIKSWPHENLNDLLSETYYLALAAAGSGYLEKWEWEKVAPDLLPPSTTSISFKSLFGRMEISRRVLEWSVGMTRGVYKDVVDQYAGFEPLVYGFYDDRVRSSCLLYLGDCVSQLGEFIAKTSNLSNHVMEIPGQSHFRGINPGYALGELVVVNETKEDMEISGDKIYIFNHPPADLKPVAGIATVTEGNMVSHVQLLARNLGIPNAVLSAENLEQLKKYNGQQVFYAVSNKGTVLMKPAGKMTAEEQKLFETKKRNELKITVPVGRINLKQTKTVNLREVHAEHSGIFCGPKAANLGQLKLMFPDQVVEGFVIPFGIFKEHMNQQMPGKTISYWEFVLSIFDQAEQMRAQGKTETDIEIFTLGQLEILRNEIKSMPLLPAFVADLQKSFVDIFGKKIGEVPVFLRSDTNMEDLKDFTGAGLNLTLFNVVDKDKILNGIKDVWASPYAERSYKWRQRYLQNPESVYPSILVIPSVDVDCSGVLITKGILNEKDDDLTIAFSRGAGGAVDGQAAESYLLTSSGENILVSPVREAFANTLPVTGGTGKKGSSFQQPILSKNNLLQIREFSDQVKRNMLSYPQTKSTGPFDIELGFKDDKLWLFQIRPFVENKNALRSEYLKSITPDIPENNQIKLTTLL
jgi:hypothetical protein